MSEGALYDRDLAALAVKQARGDLIEAIFLVPPTHDAAAFRLWRAHRYGRDAHRAAHLGHLQGSARRPDARPTFDYTHRLLDPALAGTRRLPGPNGARASRPGRCVFRTSLPGTD
ncbi:carbon-phosphorus lyase complex subunit PhnI [Roseitalea porphyridii]|uniref:carbon-phosphorus lyase complex subunit PhnI n=1 Tax=Roseitalea porphyridii TaxID=1852022 RepID=UPI003D17851B